LEHQEIRFRILSTLYQKHYSEQLGYPQNTEKIIQEAGLSEIAKSDVNGDVVYLEDKRLIKAAMKPLGHAYPPFITITSYGIDFVEKVVNQSIISIDGTDIDSRTKSEVKEISKEDSPSAKIKNLVEYAKLHTDLWLNITKIAGQFFGNIM
jgi:hypothetical protein